MKQDLPYSKFLSSSQFLVCWSGWWHRRYFARLGGARDSVAHQSIQRLGTILDIYRLDVGTYPSTEDGLQALTTQPAGVGNWKGPYLQGEKQPLDPWNHPYTYRNPSTRTGHEYDLCSGGPDGRNTDPGGAGAICNP